LHTKRLRQKNVPYTSTAVRKDPTGLNSGPAQTLAKTEQCQPLHVDHHNQNQMETKMNYFGKRNRILNVLSLISVLGMQTAATGPAFAASGVKVGVLECRIEPGIGFVIGSSKSMDCKFNPDRGSNEYYSGSITKIGVDIGITGEASMAWLVVAAGSVEPGALEGRYGGASAQATVGAGLGANALIGGFKRSIVLQPLSVQGQTGLNVAVAVTGLRLRHQEQ
jgi:Protein of unknown function (DUF992)